MCSHIDKSPYINSDRDFWSCHKCECTYIKKDLFKRVDLLNKSGINYSFRVNLLQDIENIGHVKLWISKEK